jgi:hypothetical protein
VRVTVVAGPSAKGLRNAVWQYKVCRCMVRSEKE